MSLNEEIEAGPGQNTENQQELEMPLMSSIILKKKLFNTRLRNTP